MKYIDLPSRTRAAVRAGDQRTAATAARTRMVDRLGDGRLANAGRSTGSSFSAPRAEFGVAKHTYVAHRSGWFSDRTECYLAPGRPALVQDTGWTRAPSVRRRPAGVLVARRGAGRHRSHQQRLPASRAASVGDRARAFRRRPVLPRLLDVVGRMTAVRTDPFASRTSGRWRRRFRHRSRVRSRP